MITGLTQYMKKALQIIILAAGHGKRMGQQDLPKVLVSFNGKPIIVYLLESVAKSGVDNRPVVVIGQKAEQVINTLGDGYEYVRQEEQLGTGHAVVVTENLLKDKVENVLVLYGDHPLVSSETIKNLVSIHETKKNIITMATTKISDFNDWRATFFHFGRIIRNQENKIIRIVEKKDAEPDELNVKEVNPGYYCFNAKWLWKNLSLLKSNNKQKEYYLTDLVALAINQGLSVDTVDIDSVEAFGVNTPEQLAMLSLVSNK